VASLLLSTQSAIVEKPAEPAGHDHANGAHGHGGHGHSHGPGF
jgi:chaperonin GroEL